MDYPTTGNFIEENELLPVPEPQKGVNRPGAAAANDFSSLPKNENALAVGVVCLIILIAFICIIILCWSQEKTIQRNPRLFALMADENRRAQAAIEGPRTSQAENREVILPDYTRRSSRPNNRACNLKSIDSCACTFGVKNGAPPRQKGWQRNKDYEPYGPA